MMRRTLAARVSLVQSALTLFALVAVTLGASFVVHVSLERKTDAALVETLTRAAALAVPVQGTQLDPSWVKGEFDEVRPSDVRVELRDTSGRTLAASGTGPSFRIEKGPECADYAAFRVCSRRVGLFTLVASVDRSSDKLAQQRVLASLLTVAILTGLLSTIVSRRVARRALAPLTELSARVARIEPGDHTRLEQASELEEIESLRARFDGLIQRYDESLARERRLTAQASHELRTPLGVARAEVEALTNPEELVVGRARALAALDHLSNLVETLLWFARGQSRLDDESMGIVNLADVLRTQLRERSQVGLYWQLPDEALVRGDERLLGRVTANLLDNAGKFGDGKRVEVRAEHTAKLLRIRVLNTGPAPTAADPERMFEPFFRGGGSSAETPGFGLGLPFARAVARCHGGDVEFVPNSEMTEFRLNLPLIDWNDGPGADDSPVASS